MVAPLGAVHLVVGTAILLAPLVVPVTDAIVSGIGSGVRIEGVGEGQGHAVRRDVEFFGHVNALARISDPVECSGLGLVARPAEKAREVQLTVALAEFGAGDARLEFERELDHAALTDPVDLLVKHVENLAHAVRRRNDPAPERPPAVIGYPGEGAR